MGERRVICMRDQFQNFQGLGIDRHNLTAVGESDDVESLLVGRAHRGLHAAVREEAPDGDGLDAVGLELVLEVRARERVQALLALHHDLRMGREAGGGGGGKRR